MVSAHWVRLFLAASLLLVGCAALRGAQLYTSGSQALDRGEVARAIQDLEAAAALVPDASEVHNHLGIAYGRAGRHAEALRAFEQSVALDCSNAAATANLLAAQQRPGESRP